jgi:hypothetical protein
VHADAEVPVPAMKDTPQDDAEEIRLAPEHCFRRIVLELLSKAREKFGEVGE